LRNPLPRAGQPASLHRSSSFFTRRFWSIGCAGFHLQLIDIQALDSHRLGAEPQARYLLPPFPLRQTRLAIGSGNRENLNYQLDAWKGGKYPFAARTISIPTGSRTPGPVPNQEACMNTLKGTKTHDNLKAAFAGESQANRRYLYFANKADIEGQNDVAALFRSTAEGETGHAHGHLDYLATVGDPATDLPIGSSRQNLKAAVAGETHEYTDMYPGMAKSARDEKFEEIADWFETLAKAERSHANRFQKALDALAD
jgi:rubrerythrin